MGDINNWAQFIRGRWNWTEFGYEKGFPRGCQFTDVDATVEFDGRRLFIETKFHDGTSSFEYPETGQRRSLRELVENGKTVIIVYGCGCCNNPQAIRVLGKKRPHDRFEDWRKLDITERRKKLKYEIDSAQQLCDEEDVF